MSILDDAIISSMTADIDDDTARDSDFGFAFVITYPIGLLYFDSQTPEHTNICIPASHVLRSTCISCESGDKNRK